MERKIGEIFEYDGEWCQCVEDTEYISCINCCFYNGGHKLCTDKDIGNCVGEYRSDAKSICFKKLEKVGEPFTGKVHIQLQRYNIYTKPIIDSAENVGYIDEGNTIAIEIKQNKEDMEEKKLNLKPFDIQKAKEGKPVCTRDGRKARIICFDKKEGLPIVALVETKKNGRISEGIALFYINGRAISADSDSKYDLMMLPEKKEGWVNIVRGSDGRPHMGRGIFQSKEEAENAIKAFSDNLIDIVKISWEEQP